MKRILWLAAIALGGLLIGAVYQAYRDHRFLKTWNARRHESVKLWGDGRFLKIEATPGFERELVDLIEEAEPVTILDGNMRQELGRTLALLLGAHSRGDFDSFARYRFPYEMDSSNIRFKSDRIEQMKKELRIQSYSGDVATPAAVLRAWWNVVPPLATNEFGAAIICTKDWREFGKDGFKVLSRRVSHLPLPDMYTVARQCGRVEAALHVESVAELDPTPTSLLAAGEDVVFTHCYVPVKLARKDLQACAVVVSFYWVPTVGKWFPHEMIVPTGGLSVYYLF